MTRKCRVVCTGVLTIALLGSRPGNVNAQGTPPYIGEWELPIISNPVSSPNGLAVSDDGKLYVADVTNGLVHVYTLGGTHLNQWSVPGPAHGVAVAQSGEVCVTGGFLVHVYSSTGTLLRTIGSGILVTPREVAFTPDGHLLVTDPGGHALQKFTLDGTHLASLGVGLVGEPIDVAIASDGTLYVSDESAGLNCGGKLSASGAMFAKWGSSGADLGQFNGPAGLCLDGAQNLFVCDHNNGRIQRLSLSGTAIAAWSYASPGQSMGVAIDVVSDQFGQLYVSVPGNGRIIVYGQAPVPTSRLTWGAVKAKFR